jgi:hypothetical protein
MRSILVALLLLALAVPCTADSTKAPDQVRLASGAYPDQAKLSADFLACVRSVGITTIEGLDALLQRTPTTNQEASYKLRTMANWLDCMNARGYVVPMKWVD